MQVHWEDGNWMDPLYYSNWWKKAQKTIEQKGTNFSVTEAMIFEQKSEWLKLYVASYMWIFF